MQRTFGVADVETNTSDSPSATIRFGSHQELSAALRAFVSTRGPGQVRPIHGSDCRPTVLAVNGRTDAHATLPTMAVYDLPDTVTMDDACRAAAQTTNGRPAIASLCALPKRDVANAGGRALLCIYVTFWANADRNQATAAWPQWLGNAIPCIAAVSLPDAGAAPPKPPQFPTSANLIDHHRTHDARTADTTRGPDTFDVMDSMLADGITAARGTPSTQPDHRRAAPLLTEVAQRWYSHPMQAKRAMAELHLIGAVPDTRYHRTPHGINMPNSPPDYKDTMLWLGLTSLRPELDVRMPDGPLACDYDTHDCILNAAAWEASALGRAWQAPYEEQPVPRHTPHRTGSPITFVTNRHTRHGSVVAYYMSKHRRAPCYTICDDRHMMWPDVPEDCVHEYDGTRDGPIGLPTGKTVAISAGSRDSTTIHGTVRRAYLCTDGSVQPCPALVYDIDATDDHVYVRVPAASAVPISGPTQAMLEHARRHGYHHVTDQRGDHSPTRFPNDLPTEQEARSAHADQAEAQQKHARQARGLGEKRSGGVPLRFSQRVPRAVHLRAMHPPPMPATQHAAPELAADERPARKRSATQARAISI